MTNSEFEDDLDNSKLDFELIALPRANGGTSISYKTRIYGKWLFIKRLKPEFRNDPKFIAIFKKEKELGFQLDHPNLPRYILSSDIFPSEETVVTELIQGKTLDIFLTENPHYFSDSQNVMKFISEVSDVLDYLHARQILHLDIKPSNIIITDVGRNVKLLDLGFCCSDSFQDTRGLSADFTAPERKNHSGQVSSAADYYGLGATLEFIMENTPGFPRSKFKSLIQKLLEEEPSKRVKNKDEIRSLLEGNKKLAAVSYILAGLILIFLIGVLFFWRGNTAPTLPTDGNTAKKTDSIEINSVSSQNYENLPDIEPNYRKISTQSDVKISDINLEKRQEALKLKIHENYRLIFNPLRKQISSSIENGNFSEEEHDRLLGEINKAISQSMKLTPYISEFPDLSEDYIILTMTDEMKLIENESWKDEWKRYVSEYSSILSSKNRD